MAQTSLGNGSTIDFGLVKDGAGAAQLRLDLTWQRAYARVAAGQPRVRRHQQLVGATPAAS